MLNVITITDTKGNTLSWASAGSIGFKGTRKGSPFASQTASEKVITKALSFGLKKNLNPINRIGLNLVFVFK